MRYYDGYDWDVDGFPGEYVYGDECYDPYFGEERWLPVKDFPDYWVSNKGRLYSSVSGDFIGGTPLKNGHIDVSIKRNGMRFHRYLHRMVAEAFIPNPYNLPMVRHLDDNPWNNEVENLAWGTQTDNMRDAIKNGTFYFLDDEAREKAMQARRTPIVAIDIFSGTTFHFKSQQEASSYLLISQPDISACVTGKRSNVGNWKFKYDVRRTPDE